MTNQPISQESVDTQTPPASWEDWVQRFAPLTNPDGNDSWNGFLFETHGTEFFRVREAARTKPGTVWTLLDCDGRFVIADGLHMVNRFGYFLTERAYTGPMCEFADEDEDEDDESQEREQEWESMRDESEDAVSGVSRFDAPDEDEHAPRDDTLMQERD
ncbi:MAG TPA: hypothetical protein VN259_17240 [Xanthomonadales bacterium]|nr:hypothetical protein [Xanthomonadales bacterium]